MIRFGSALLTAVLFITPFQPVWAGGYDTPILYSARHMGMGGVAISYVDEPSAMFHNPAGLGHIDFISATAAVSPITGTIEASFARSLGDPLDNPGLQATSEQSLAPFFLAGGGFRLADFLTFGVGVYPVAAAGATYKYDVPAGNSTANIEDSTTITFIEISPALAFNWRWLRIGVGWRASLVTLDRVSGPTAPGTSKTLDLQAKGWNFEGFRAGVQVSPLPELQLGIVYRHKITTTLESDKFVFVGTTFGDTELDFTLPSKLGVGVRYDFAMMEADWIAPLSVAVDFEWLFNSQQTETRVFSEPAGGGEASELIVNQFRWSDAPTIRAGVEYDVTEEVPVRLGYIYDGKTGNKAYPTAFGTPPAATQTITAGCGYVRPDWEVNLAYAYRFGSASVSVAELNDRDHGPCGSCSRAGDYEMGLHGIYADFTYHWR